MNWPKRLVLQAAWIFQATYKELKKSIVGSERVDYMHREGIIDVDPECKLLFMCHLPRVHFLQFLHHQSSAHNQVQSLIHYQKLWSSVTASIVQWSKTSYE